MSQISTADAAEAPDAKNDQDAFSHDSPVPGTVPRSKGFSRPDPVRLPRKKRSPVSN